MGQRRPRRRAEGWVYGAARGNEARNQRISRCRHINGDNWYVPWTLWLNLQCFLKPAHSEGAVQVRAAAGLWPVQRPLARAAHAARAAAPPLARHGVSLRSCRSCFARACGLELVEAGAALSAAWGCRELASSCGAKSRRRGPSAVVAIDSYSVFVDASRRRRQGRALHAPLAPCPQTGALSARPSIQQPSHAARVSAERARTRPVLQTTSALPLPSTRLSPACARPQPAGAHSVLFLFLCFTSV